MSRYIVCSKPGEFAAILKWRMREHKRKQDREAERMTREIIDEIVDALAAHTVSQHERAGVLPFPEAHNFQRRAEQ